MLTVVSSLEICMSLLAALYCFFIINSTNYTVEVSLEITSISCGLETYNGYRIHKETI